MNIIKEPISGQPKVRPAVSNDIEGIMNVACSVGNESKVHTAGFLMDDYRKDYDVFKEKFSKLIEELEHFYVVEIEDIIGFLIAYKKEEWLRYNPEWIKDIFWHPEFRETSKEEFILVDKTAVMKGLTGKGIGSLLYKSLISGIKQKGISNMFAETLISPVPNFASLEFRIKQAYKLAGVRYEDYKGSVYTSLVYHKGV